MGKAASGGPECDVDRQYPYRFTGSALAATERDSRRESEVL